MKPFTLLMLCTLLSLTITARAADLTGTWQADGKPQRVLKLHKAGHGYHGDFYDLGPEAAFTPRYNSVSGILLSGNDVHFSLDKADGSFDGTLSNDGRTLAGTWNMLYFPTQAITFVRASAKDAWVPDPSLHKTHFVTVQHGVRLEVLDWGGSGPPLIFLAGLGGTGHSFDGFA